MLCEPAASLGAPPLTCAFDGVTFGNCLGHGASCTVLSVVGDGLDGAYAKVFVSIYPALADAEAFTLTKLAEHGVPHAPSLLRPARQGQLQQYPVGRPLKVHALLQRHAKQAVACLRRAHLDAGLVNRDIRPENTGLVSRDGGDTELLFCDWGAAVLVGTHAPCAGAFYGASDAVLAHLKAGGGEYVSIPADDLVSLVSMFFAVQHDVLHSVRERTDPHLVWIFWAARLEGESWIAAYEAVLVADYDALESLVPAPLASSG